MEAVFRPEIVRIFSVGFLSNSCVFRREPVANHRKKSGKIPVFSGRSRPVLIYLGLYHLFDAVKAKIRKGFSLKNLILTVIQFFLLQGIIRTELGIQNPQPNVEN